MAGSVSIPLPRAWPRVVKSALLHAVGLERLALSEVRAVPLELVVTHVEGRAHAHLPIVELREAA